MADKTVVNLVKSGDPSKLDAAVAEMRERLPGMIEYQRIIAKLQRETYLACIKEGFTDKQALELAKFARP